MRFVTPQLDEPIAYPKAVRRAVAQKQRAVRQEWREHNERIRPLLPTGLQFLLDFSLDDALVLSLVPPSTLFLRLTSRQPFPQLAH